MTITNKVFKSSAVFSAIALALGLSLGGIASDAAAAKTETAAEQSRTVPLDRIAAVVNNDVISEVELQQRVHQSALNLRRQGIQLPPMENLRTQVLERMIVERIIAQRARDTGLRIDDQLLNGAIEQIAHNNNMTVPQLQEQLAKDGVSFRSFQSEIRNELITQRLRERDVDDTIKIPESEVDQYIKEQMGPDKRREYHLARIVIEVPQNLTREKLAEVQSTANSVLDQARHGADFGLLAAKYSRGPEAMQGGSMGWKTGNRLPPMLFESVKGHGAGEIVALRTPNSFQIVKILDTKEATTGVDDVKVEQTHVRHIMLRPTAVTPEKVVISRLKEIKDKLDRGDSDFSTLARLYSADPSGTRGGDIGWLYPGDVHPAMEAEIAKLKNGDISEPFQTPYGWHILQVLDRRVQAGINDRLRMQAREALREQKLQDATIDWERKLREEAYVEIRNNREHE